MNRIIAVLLLALPFFLCTSCDKETKGLKEEISVLRQENNFLKAENIALKKEIEELYKRIEDRAPAGQKQVTKEENAAKDKPQKKTDKPVETEKAKKP